MAKGMMVEVKGCRGVWRVAKVWPEAKVCRVECGGVALLVRASETREVVR